MSVSLYKSIELESFKDNAIAIFDKANGLRLLLEPISSNISFVFLKQDSIIYLSSVFAAIVIIPSNLIFGAICRIFL